MTPALVAVAAVALGSWLAVLLHPARPWDMRPRDDEDGSTALPDPRPRVAVLVPARNEAAALRATLPALLAQDYPGGWEVVLVDDRSDDETAAVARSLGSDRLTVVDGAPLPEGWVGKVWALAQAAGRAEAAEYLLLTDADIVHAPESLSLLVADSSRLGLALNSRMAHLHAVNAVERLLVPAFVHFFALLYPMRWVNDPRRRLAAAAGGCVLLRRDTLDAIGGFDAIQDAVIDDVALARCVKRLGLPIRLATSTGRVVSVREYATLGAFWRTIRRTAFTQLRGSWALLIAVLAVLGIMFAGPPVLLVLAAGGATPGWLAAPAAAAWAAMAAAYAPTARLYGLSGLSGLALPVTGILYGAMTLDSAVRQGRGW